MGSKFKLVNNVNIAELEKRLAGLRLSRFSDEVIISAIEEYYAYIRGTSAGAKAELECKEQREARRIALQKDQWEVLIWLLVIVMRQFLAELERRCSCLFARICTFIGFKIIEKNSDGKEDMILSF